MKALRNWIMALEIIGSIISVAVLAGVAYYLQDEAGGLTEGENAFVLTVLIYGFVKTIVSTVFICNAAKNWDDQDLIGGRWIMSALCLSMGGIFLPFLLAAFPNVNVKSKKNPRVFLGQVLGLTLAIAGGINLVVYGAVVNTKAFGGQGAYNDVASIITLVANGVIFIFGALACGFFVRKGAEDIYAKGGAQAGFMKFLGYTFVFFITLELIVLLVWNWIELLSQAFTLISRSRDRNGNFNWGKFFINLINFYITILYVLFISKVVCETIKGIWDKQPVEFKVFAPLEKQQQKQVQPA